MNYMLHRLIEKHPLIEFDVMVGLMLLDRATEERKWVKFPDTTVFEDMVREGFIERGNPETMAFFFAKREEFVDRLTNGEMTVKEYLSRIYQIPRTGEKYKGKHFSSGACDRVKQLWDKYDGRWNIPEEQAEMSTVLNFNKPTEERETDE